MAVDMLFMRYIFRCDSYLVYSKQEVKMMKRLCKLVTSLLFRYGLIVGKQPSYHLTYEAAVPKKLKSESNIR